MWTLWQASFTGELLSIKYLPPYLFLNYCSTGVQHIQYVEHARPTLQQWLKRVSRSLSAAKIPSLSAVRTQVLNRSLSAAKNPSLSAVRTQVLNC